MHDSDQQETYLRTRLVRRESIEAADDPTAGPWQFSGVSVAPGDVLHTPDGGAVLMTESELRKAASSQKNQKLTDDHPEYDGGSPPRDATIGDVLEAEFVPGKGIVYQAQTHDPDVAAGIHAGTYDVSIHAGFETDGTDPDTGAKIARNVSFADLSVVGIGDSRAGTAEWGASADLAAWANSGGIEAALSASDDSPGDAPGADNESTASLWHRLGSRLGVASDATTTDETQAQTSDESAESDSGSDTKQMTNDRDDDITFITANSHFSEELLADMDDDELEQTRDLVDSEDDSDGEGAGEQTTDDSGTDGAKDVKPNTVEVDIGDHDSFDAYLDDKIGQHEVSASKSDQVEEIIAASDDYGDGDREELMASPPGVVRKIHTTATKPGAAFAPMAGGASKEVEASIGEDEHDLDAFGTGVAE